MEYSLPESYRIQERWLRRAQHEYYCRIPIGIGKCAPKCNCIWYSKERPFYKFWKCEECIHKSKLVFFLIFDNNIRRV